ncbi:GNAT family N-acetyltransferase [Herbiconiux sp. L3-i23]|uniref:GNAT family N-acetyltransferase n=1 Tax=Herbiconiux sp. L3-i23 TaxID=2905871 RepID=UPI00206E04F3|nr:GNAT family N-acetyltransferase [Herbiconiux sp. L3-i23]BDI23602.1 acetyltransferase [Herbiconiux sp. L3-i23]
MPLTLRPYAEADLTRLVDLNNAAYPAVPIVGQSELDGLIALSSLALVAADDDGLAHGFLLALDPGADYASENYLYFSERAASTGRSSLYIDRIVIDEAARGAGLGRRFYEAAFERAAADGRDEVTCEVNIEPPNPESLAFHGRMGFERIGEQETKGGRVIVALLSAPVSR